MCVWACAQINVMQQHIFAFERLANSKKTHSDHGHLADTNCHWEHCHLTDNHIYAYNKFTDIANSLATNKVVCYKRVAQYLDLYLTYMMDSSEHKFMFQNYILIWWVCIWHCISVSVKKSC